MLSNFMLLQMAEAILEGETRALAANMTIEDGEYIPVD